MVVEDEGFVHKLIIANPTLADMGKYTCDVNGIITEAYLEVEGTSAGFVFRFIIQATGFFWNKMRPSSKRITRRKKVLLFLFFFICKFFLAGRKCRKSTLARSPGEVCPLIKD